MTTTQKTLEEWERTLGIEIYQYNYVHLTTEPAIDEDFTTWLKDFIRLHLSTVREETIREIIDELVKINETGKCLDIPKYIHYLEKALSDPEEKVKDEDCHCHGGCCMYQEVNACNHKSCQNMNCQKQEGGK